MKILGRTIRRLYHWLGTRPVNASAVACCVARDGFNFGWFYAAVLTWLVYWFVSDGDRLRSNITINVKPDATTDALYRIAKSRDGGAA